MTLELKVFTKLTYGPLSLKKNSLKAKQTIKRRLVPGSLPYAPKSVADKKN